MTSNIFCIQNNIFELQLLNNQHSCKIIAKKTQQKAIGTQCFQGVTLPSTEPNVA